MTTFNDAIKDETQITDEKITEYGQTVRIWLEKELGYLASEYQENFITAVKRVNDIIAGTVDDSSVFDSYYVVVSNEKYQVNYIKTMVSLNITLTLTLPDDIFQLFKIGEYVNFPLFKEQLDGAGIKVKGEKDDEILIDTGFLFVSITQQDETHVSISLIEY